MEEAQHNIRCNTILVGRGSWQGRHRRGHHARAPHAPRRAERHRLLRRRTSRPTSRRSSPARCSLPTAGSPSTPASSPTEGPRCDSADVLGTTVLHDVADGVATITLNRPEAANALRADQRDVMIELLARGRRRSDGAGGRAAFGGKALLLGRRPRGHQRRGKPANRGGRRHAPDDAGRAAADRRGARLRRSPSSRWSRVRRPGSAPTSRSRATWWLHRTRRTSSSRSCCAASWSTQAARTCFPGWSDCSAAKELAFLGDKLPAGRCQGPRAGEPGRARRRSWTRWPTSCSARLAAAPTTALSLTKRLFNRSLDGDRAASFLEEAMAQELQSRSDDAREGVAAFMERRPPEFRGR